MCKTLLSHIMKLLERILDVRIRKKVEQELGEEQQGFRKGRRTTDGMFALRQMVEKRLEMQGRMAVGYVDLEKAYDTVPRDDGNSEMDGSARSRSWDGGSNV